MVRHGGRITSGWRHSPKSRRLVRKGSAGRTRRVGKKRGPARAKNVKVVRSREFIWGGFQVSGTAGAASPTQVALATPNNLGATTVTLFSVPAGSNVWNAGTGHSFSIWDLPAEALAFIQIFEQYRITGITLKIKPLHLATSSTQVVTAGGTTTQIIPSGRLRMFIARVHDPEEVSAPTSIDDVLRYDTHQIIDLTDTKLIRIIPSTTGMVLDQAGDAVPGPPQYGKWNSVGTTLTNTTSQLYEGLKVWWEWENPPVTYVGVANAQSFPVEIFATYTVEVKEVTERGL